MPIPLISKIKPKNNGLFPVYEDVDVEGGFQVRATIAARDSIPTLNRKEGMLVYVVAEGYFYQLGAGLTNSDWYVSDVNGFVNGGLAYFSSITELKNFDATNLPDGYVSFVTSNLSWYEFINSAAGYTDDTIDFLIIQPTSGPINSRWFRTKSDHPIWLSTINNFYINESSGSNENNGITSLSPLKNWQELARRLGENEVLNDIVVNIDGYLTEAINVIPVWTKTYNLTIKGTFSPINPSAITLSATTQRDRPNNVALGINKASAWSSTYQYKLAKYNTGTGDGYGILISIDPSTNTRMWTTDFYVENSINPPSYTLDNPNLLDALYVYNLSNIEINYIETEGTGTISFVNCTVRGNITINKSNVNFIRCLSNNSTYFQINAYANAKIYINTCFIDSICANQGSKIKITNTYVGVNTDNYSIALNGGMIDHISDTAGDIIFDQSTPHIPIQNLTSDDGYVPYNHATINNICILNPSSSNIIELKVPYSSVVLKNNGSIYASSNVVNTGFIININTSNCTFMCKDVSPNIYIQKDNSGNSVNNDEFQLFGNTYTMTDDFPISDLVRFSGLYQY